MSNQRRGTQIPEEHRECMQYLAAEVTRTRAELLLSRATTGALAGLTEQRVRDVELARCRPAQSVLDRLAWTFGCIGGGEDPDNYDPSLLINIFMWLADDAVVMDRRASDDELDAIERRVNDRWDELTRKLSRLKSRAERIPRYDEPTA